MNYYLDTEFIEGTQKTLFGNTKPTIDLISIGIVAEDGREYYAISKDFNLKEAWNRYDLKINKLYPIGPEYNKVYWIRENVLKPIWRELMIKDGAEMGELENVSMSYKWFKKLINKYGKTNKQIAEEVYNFCTNDYHKGNNLSFEQRKTYDLYDNFKPEFYGYYSDYDWVVFCWLFGKMIDLPKGFPMFAFDIQQQIEEYKINKEQLLKEVPQINCHNSLHDAIWNKDAYNWIQKKNKMNNGCKRSI